MHESQLPTIAGRPGSASLKSWLEAHRSELRHGDLVLPEGLEIGHRYRVLGLIGRGGMGAVYKVHDRELSREVALKLIRSDLADRPTALERFKREIHLSSQITHRNVLRVYDLGESQEVKFLTMQLVEGEDLGQLLHRDGRLPLERALDIFRQACEGLAAAHELGVIHRDLKPSNIMLDGTGRVYVTDFGLAKSLDLSTLTETGALVGTPHYMSPEQVRGEELDRRSDVYSLGVILYEMLAGGLPYPGRSAYEAMIQRVQRLPTPIAELNPEVPAWLAKVLDRCMAMDPSLRYASASEVLLDLEARTARTSLLHEFRRRGWKTSAGVAATVLVLATGAWWFHRAGRQEHPGAERAGGGAKAVVPVVGVLPFENHTGDSSFDWYGEGLARVVMDSLAQSHHLQVVSMDRMDDLREANPGRSRLVEAAAKGGIGFLLSGEILRGPDGLAIASRLTETSGRRDIAPRRAAGLAPEAVIRASDTIAAQVRAELGVPLTEKVAYLAADFPTKNLPAYRAYIAGLRAYSSFRYDEAERYFRTALEEAPDYAMARYRVAWIEAVGGRTSRALEEIRLAAAGASRLSEREVLYVRAAEAYFSRRYEETITIYRELLRLFPQEIEARAFLAQALMDTGAHDEAMKLADELFQLEPDSAVAWSIRGHAHLGRKEYSQAVQAFQRYVELEPAPANGHHVLADAYCALGEYDLAAGEYRRALESDRSFHYSAVSLGVVEALAGRRDEAERRLSALAADAGVPPRFRIDSAVELAYLFQAEGRLREATSALTALEKEVAAEGIREALALSLRGVSLMGAGDLSGARALIERAIERSPGVPTRYLFARGLLELRQGRLPEARRTAEQILKNALPPDNPDRTEEKAAAYLTGMALLGEGKASEAAEALTRAVALQGYEYRLYRLGLAEAHLAAGRVPEALAAAREAAESRPRERVSLELEPDRTRALLVLARVHEALGSKPAAVEQARRFLEAWHGANRGLPDLDTARRLAGG